MLHCDSIMTGEPSWPLKKLQNLFHGFLWALVADVQPGAQAGGGTLELLIQEKHVKTGFCIPQRRAGPVLPLCTNSTGKVMLSGFLPAKEDRSMRTAARPRCTTS